MSYQNGDLTFEHENMNISITYHFMCHLDYRALIFYARRQLLPMIPCVLSSLMLLLFMHGMIIIIRTFTCHIVVKGYGHIDRCPKQSPL
jgi:hypothetical protein